MKPEDTTYQPSHDCYLTMPASCANGDHDKDLEAQEMIGYTPSKTNSCSPLRQLKIHLLP